MLQKVRTPLDALGDLPTSRNLAAARERLAEAVRLEGAAASEFRVHCARVEADGRWVRNDRFATSAENDALAAAAAARLASNDMEVVRRAHGDSLNKHLARHEAASFEIMIEELRSAHATARKIAKAVQAAERDGASPSHKLRKVRRVANDLSTMLARLA